MSFTSGIREPDELVRFNFFVFVGSRLGGSVASWLARSTPERALRVGALAGDIVLCS